LQFAVAILRSFSGLVVERAPVGQEVTQGNCSQNLQNASPQRSVGVPLSKSFTIITGFKAKKGQDLTQLPHREHSSMNLFSLQAPGGLIRSGNFSAKPSSSSPKAVSIPASSSQK